jgi:hypothetical protein
VVCFVITEMVMPPYISMFIKLRCRNDECTCYPGEALTNAQKDEVGSCRHAACVALSICVDVGTLFDEGMSCSKTCWWQSASVRQFQPW